MNTHNLIKMCHNLIFKPQDFFREYKDSKLSQMPGLIIIIIIYGLFYGIDRTDRVVQKTIISENNIGNLNESWFTYWIVVFITAIMVGYFSYIIGVWFYNLRIKWSKGKDSKLLSQKIILYSYFLVGTINLIISILDSIFYANPAQVYFSTGLAHEGIEIVLIVILCIALYHSLFISYKGVTTVEGISKIRAFIWFVLLPGIMYIFAIISAIVLVSRYFG